MTRATTARKTTKRPQPQAHHTPNPWKILLAKDFPNIPFEKALILYRRRLEKIVAEAVAEQALRKARRRTRSKIAKSP